MQSWTNAIVVAVVGFAIVFVVLALLMMAMQAVGGVLSRMGAKKAEEKP